MEQLKNDLSSDHKPLPKGKWLLFVYKGEKLQEGCKIRWVVENEWNECGEDKTHSTEGYKALEYTCYRGEHRLICQIVNRFIIR